MSNYLDEIKSAVTRNQNKIKEIQIASFWIEDQKQEDGTNCITIEFSSHDSWLKVTQSYGDTCYIFPIDGPSGVFEANGLPTANSIQYEWHTQNGIENRNAGDCDCLILHKKLHFLEFKTAASSQDLTQINNNRNKAEAQLAKSITSFGERFNKKFGQVCVIVAPDFFSYPKFKASFSRKISFMKKHKCELKEVHISNAYKLD